MTVTALEVVPAAQSQRNGGSLDNAERAALEQRRERVAVMLLSRLSYREIARREGIGLASVGRDVKAVRAMLAERAAQSYDAWIAEEGSKLDGLERAWVPRALSGDAEASAALLKIMEHRAKLLGLAPPAKVEHAGQVEIVAAQAADVLLDELEARRQKRSA